jgi:hypothetical protein
MVKLLRLLGWMDYIRVFEEWRKGEWFGFRFFMSFTGDVLDFIEVGITHFCAFINNANSLTY